MDEVPILVDAGGGYGLTRLEGGWGWRFRSGSRGSWLGRDGGKAMKEAGRKEIAAGERFG